MSEVTGACELGRRKGDDHYSFVRVYEVRSDPFDGPYEEFVLGEPVHLKTIRSMKGSRIEMGADAIWWIQEMIEVAEEPKVGVSDGRNKPALTFVPPSELEKLPGMVRLAAEYAF